MSGTGPAVANGLAKHGRVRRLVLIGATLGNMVGLTPAVASVFGLFLIPLSETFGWSRAAISGVLVLISIGPALMSPLVGRLADRVGTRLMLVIGNVGLAASIALLALTTRNILQFYLTFALVAIFAAFASVPVLAKLVSDWHETSRGMALGISAGLGNGIGSAALPALAALVLVQAGWRAAYLSVAGAVLLIGLPAFLLLVRDAGNASSSLTPRERRGMTLAEASRDRGFWITGIAIASAAGALTAIFSHMVPILQERGVDVGDATLLLGIFALATAAWQMLSGWILDRARTSIVILPMYLASVAGIALIVLGDGMLELTIAALLLAIGLGTQFSALPYLLGRYFGLRHFGAIVGAAYSAVFVFQGLVPVILDHFYDVQATYEHVMLGMAGCLALGGLALLFLPSYRFNADDSMHEYPHA